MMPKPRIGFSFLTILSGGSVAPGDELGVKERRRSSSAQDAVEPARSRENRLGLARAEIVAGARDAHEIDSRVARRDAFEDRKWAELVLFALDDERRTGHRGKSRLVARARALRRGDRMAEDDQRVRRFALGEERRDAAAERAPDKRNALTSLGAKRIARDAKVLDFRRVVLARPLPAGPKCHGAGRYAEPIERRCERAQDRLLRRAAVSGRQDCGAFHAGGFGSF